MRYKKIGCDYSDLSSASGLDVSKIKEIETYRPQISAETLLRLSRIMGIDLMGVMRCVNLSTHFASSFATKEQGRALVIQTNDVIGYIHNAGKASVNSKLKLLAQAASEALDHLPNTQSYALFTNLFNDSQVNRCEIFAMGSAFCMQDFRAYLHHLIKENFPENSLTEMSKHAEVPYSSLTGMLSGEPDKILFADVCQIDSAMLQEGQLASVCWKAVECQLGLIRTTSNGQPPQTWNANETTIFEKLMQDYRFYRATRPDYQDWADTLLSQSSENLKDMIEIA